MTRLALIGYGKMGKIIETLATAKGHHITAVVDPYAEGCFQKITQEALSGADVCIDFTHPQVVVSNIEQMAALGKNMVIGTTGWYNQIDKVKQVVNANQVGLIWSGNFSIGVNALFKIVAYAARVFNNLPDYDVLGHEVHHKNKADSPSGTATMLGRILLDNIQRKQKLVYKMLDRKIEPDELHFSSSRGGAIPGTHLIMFDSAVDTIEIKHTARGREGFAAGALMATEFIQHKIGFYNINDLMDDLLPQADE
ncbi:MAG: 4-hydroxy-tetrahydrodipicolinate reductase [Anaerolineae bacterium]|nr:4-hydroxy-tetrahydrodipicolinate reductase [Anaerolineae bacterium]